MKISDQLVDALDRLVDVYGKPPIVHPPMCYDEARRYYRSLRPSSKSRHPKVVPMYNGNGVVLGWEPTDELLAAAQVLGVNASPLEGYTAIFA